MERPYKQGYNLMWRPPPHTASHTGTAGPDPTPGPSAHMSPSGQTCNIFIMNEGTAV